MKYDLIIAGCGFAGATIANLAAKDGKKVLVYEKRNHIAGNMYDERNEDHILVQKYGPHSFHTNDEKVYQYISSFGKWHEHILTARVMINDVCTPSPFNFRTIDQFYFAEKAELLKAELLKEFPGREKVTVVELMESNSSLIREYADFLFENDYRPYTAKQWGIAPEKLDISILKRVPVRLTYKDGYFDDKWQLMPDTSFTEIFAKMLANENIKVELNTDALEKVQIDSLSVPFVYTGPLDELFDCKYGKLPYRSLYFDFQTHNVDSYQETSGVAYPKAEGFTRITEYTKLPVQKTHGKTTIAVEYPSQYGSEKGKEPYYPILTEQSNKMYLQYKSDADKVKSLYLCGRLAEFKYYNMDQVIERAMEVYDQIK